MGFEFLPTFSTITQFEEITGRLGYIANRSMSTKPWALDPGDLGSPDGPKSVNGSIRFDGWDRRERKQGSYAYPVTWAQRPNLKGEPTLQRWNPPAVEIEIPIIGGVTKRVSELTLSYPDLVAEAVDELRSSFPSVHFIIDNGPARPTNDRPWPDERRYVEVLIADGRTFAKVNGAELLQNRYLEGRGYWYSPENDKETLGPLPGNWSLTTHLEPRFSTDKRFLYETIPGTTDLFLPLKQKLPDTHVIVLQQSGISQVPVVVEKGKEPPPPTDPDVDRVSVQLATIAKNQEGIIELLSKLLVMLSTRS